MDKVAVLFTMKQCPFCHMLKEMLGLGLILPKTMIAIQGLQMYLGNKRIKSNASRMIRVLEEQIWVESGLNKNLINNNKKQYWTTSWIDKVKEHLKQKYIGSK